MKKFLFIGLSLACFLLIWGCSKNDSLPSQQDSRPKVLSTTAMIGDLVTKVGGEKINHSTLIIGDIDPHSYELVKGDGERVEEANLVFYNGLGLEHGASLAYSLKHHPNSIPLAEKMGDMNLFHRIEGELDPHIWMDVNLWSKSVPIIVESLKQICPEESQFFEENGKLLLEEMDSLDQDLQALFRAIPEEKRYLVTSHDAFHYFTKRYLSEDGEDWHLRCQAPEGLSPDTQLSLNDLGRIVDHLCRYRISVIFPESNLSRDALKKISMVCAKKGHRVTIAGESLYGDTMGDLDSGVRSYFDMIRHNAQVIANHLGEKDE